MRHAKHENGSRRFTVDEFLAPQQIESYFSRMAAKLKMSGTLKLLRNNMLIPPGVATKLSADPPNHYLCELYARKNLTKLSVPILRLLCSPFEMEIDNLPLRLKKPYVKFIEELVRVCS